MEGKTCFFCLTSEPGDFTVTCGGDGGGGGVNILLKYLLGTKNSRYQSLLEDILKYLPGEDGGDDGGSLEDLCVQICGRCKASVDKIGKLHQQLEVLQMKMISEVKAVRETILQCFGGERRNRSEEEVREMVELFLGESKCLEREMGRRRLLEMISRFQMAVYDNGVGAVEIPFVFLDKYSFSRHQLPRDLPPEPAIIVKTEPVEGAEVSCFLEDDHYDDTISNFEDDPPYQPTSSDVPVPTVPKLKLKLKRKQRKAPRHRVKKTPQSEVKMEVEVADIESTSVSVKKEPRLYRKRPRETPRPISSRIAKLKQVKPSDLAVQIDKSSVIKERKKKPGPKPLPKKKVKKKLAKRRIYYCEVCPFKIKYAHIFECHLRSHETQPEDSTASPSFTCLQCSKQFFTKQLYTFHMKGHEGVHRFVCDFCTELIPYPDMVDHVKTHVDKIFTCPNCSFCSATRDKYLIHLRAHGKGRLDCDLCSKFFGTKGKLMEHLYLEHQAVDKYVCEMDGCDKEFYDIAYLRLHMNIHKKPWECQECGKVFQDNYRLKIHQKSHTGERNFGCPDCSETFTSRANLERHCIKSHGAAKHKCQYCDKEYTDKSMLKIHMVHIHEGNGIPCGICDKVFGSKALWRRHQVVHATEQNFICEDCGKGFTSRQGLTKHAKIHGGEKTFKCQFCDKAFLFSKYLRDHERTHTGERPFTCELCGKSFTQYGSLYLHNNKHHPWKATKSKVPPPTAHPTTSSVQDNCAVSAEPKPDVSAIDEFLTTSASSIVNVTK